MNSLRRVHTSVRGLTLLEMLLVLALISTLFGLLWQLVSLYSRHYEIGEKRMTRAQLVRSVSQILSDDLGSAVQDPIHPVRTGGDTDAGTIRRFGLRGDAVSLAIDVVEPNLLTDTATVEENRSYLSSGGKPMAAQVPELKTVYYEFVPMGTRARHQTSDSTSLVIGTLQNITPDISSSEQGEFVRKFGLSRRELDFETPTANTVAENKNGDSTEEPELIGSLSGPPISSFSSEDYSDGLDENRRLLEGMTPEVPLPLGDLTASQIAMEIEDGTMWAPEVVDCRFRYFDGQYWYDSWNSIERSGLPVAVSVNLRLMTLDDVERLRLSPFRSQMTGIEMETADSGVIGEIENSGDTRNGSRRVTLDDAVEVLELEPAINRMLMCYLPTTPLAQHQIEERRKPIALRKEAVRNQNDNQNVVSTVEGERHQNNTARSAQDRTAAQRIGTDRTLPERFDSGRTAVQRTDTDRITTRQFGTSRTAETRSDSAREATERPISQSERLPARETFPSTNNKVPSEEKKIQSDSSMLEAEQEGLVPTEDQIKMPMVSERSADQRSEKRQTWIRVPKK